MLSSKQNEYIREATHRINMKVGAVRSGKSYVDVTYMIPRRIREVSGKEGLNVILGVSRETIERNVLGYAEKTCTAWVRRKYHSSAKSRA